MNYIGTILILILIIAVGIIYYLLAKSRKKIEELYSNMDGNLKRRWNLIPNLVEITKGSSIYEETSLEKLVTIQNQPFENFQMKQKLEVDDNISKVFSKMMEMAKNDSDLSVNAEYQNLSNQLIQLEDEINYNKKEYAERVEKYNKDIEKIPNNIVAILFGFNEEEFFETTSK